jgi:serralysin
LSAINGTEATETLRGDRQDDVIDGAGGNDTIDGEAGNDLLVGGKGKDRLIGGEGIDTVDYSQATKGIIADLNRDVVLAPIYGTSKKPRIMPLGDSITEGGHTIEPFPGAYRIQLWKNFSADGLSINFVGSQSNGSRTLGDKDHEGHGGWAIGDIADLIVSDRLLKTYRPDIVLLEIGTNDTGGSSLREMSNELSNLIDLIAQQSPTTLILVSSITPIDPNGSKKIKEATANKAQDFNAHIPNLIEDKAAEGKKVAFVDAGGSLTIEDLGSDGIHPSSQGYKKLGNRWYDALVERDTLFSVENVIGTAYRDKLLGDAESNVLEGGAGRDILAGGGGIDTFIWRSLLHGGDTITDFGTDDFLQISAAGFGGGLVAGKPLSLAEATTGVFVSSTNPLSLGNSANFLYDTATGILSFDSDGIGINSAVTLAKFSGLPTLDSTQILIVT